MKMENEIQVEAFPRRVWSVMRVLFFMLKKGVSKKKIALQLNLILKRGKFAGKSVGNLMSNHRPATDATTEYFYKTAMARGEYEFSCSNTPAHHKFLFKKKQPRAHYETVEEELNDVLGVSASPVLPGLLGFRQTRVSDSPYPVSFDRVDEGDRHVDDDAEEFIMRFYSQLKRQSLTDG